MPSNHFNALATHILTEWAARTVLQDGSYIEHDGNRYWFVYGPNGRQIASWECRPFPGCASLIVTSKLEIREDMRGLGLGKFFREMQHKAYKRAGFAGEISTIRTDNAAMNAIASGVPMGEFTSDFGGSYKLWLTTFSHPALTNQVPGVPTIPLAPPPTAPTYTRPTMNMDEHVYVYPTPTPAPIVDTCDHLDYIRGGFCDRPLGHQGEHVRGHGLIEGQSLHDSLDEIAMRVGTVQPLPGDGVGMTREESDESLRERIKPKYSHWK